ncbi:unnamed protein product, partial [Closterium sp. NIES-54]
MVQQVLQRFGFTYSSPQATPLPTRHSLSALPSDESVESSGPYPELVGCLMYLMTCTRPDLAYPLSILARYVAPGRHRPEHMTAAKRATQRSSQGYTFSLGSSSVSWRATRSSSVLGSSCEGEIYAGAMAAQKLRWLTYLLTDLGEPPRSPRVLYVDNKAMLALCREQRLEHRTKHIALRYFLARELQQRGQLRLAYVASEANTADVFTKALAPCDHQRFCTQLVLRLWPSPQSGFHIVHGHHHTISRMTTKNGGVRHTDTLAANSLDKTKEASVVTDASASSAVKRTSDLFTETDKDALQPGVTAQRVLEATRSLTGSAVPAATATSTDGADKPVPADGAGGNNENQEKCHATTTVTATDDEDEDDGYLSDDPEERYDASAKNEVAQRVRFAIILLIPLAFKPEVTWVQATLRALFTLWRKELKFEIQGETKFQELSVVYLNKKQYSRLQVTFECARDANFVWKHGIVHVCLGGKRISLDWQHPVDPAYVKARAADPSLVEILFKEVDAAITPEMVREMLVTVKLEKRGRSAFKEGFFFHRVVNPVTGMDTDKVKGLVKQHAGDKYRWRHMIEDPTAHDKQLMVHYPSQSCVYCSGFHMTRYHDDYVADRKNNIGKWSLTLGRVHGINGNGWCFLTAHLLLLFLWWSDANVVDVSDPRSRLSPDHRSDQAYLERPGGGADLDWSEPRGMDLRAGVLREGEWGYLCSGSRACGLTEAQRWSDGWLCIARLKGWRGVAGGEEGVRSVMSICGQAVGDGGVRASQNGRMERVVRHSCGGLNGGYPMSNTNRLSIMTLNVNGLGSEGKRQKLKRWIKTAADVVVLADTRVAEDHNFWTELQPHSVAAAGAPTRAGGVAILSFRDGVVIEDVHRHASGRLLHARVRWGARQLRLLALRDVFREFNPDERQFTFFCGSAKVSSRIDRVLASQALLHLVSRVAHRKIPKGITDHKCGVCVRMAWRGAQGPGPSVWRFPARLAKRPGVAVVVAEVVRKHEAEGGGVFDKLSKCLGARLRKYDKEERRRVRRTRRTLEEQVNSLQQKAMVDPNDDTLQAVLASKEAMLERYWDGRRSLLQTRMGLRVQLNGEAPTALLSALVKSRKAKSGIKELVRNGVSHTEAREVLAAATSHFAEVFGEQSGGDGAEPALEWAPRRILDEASAEVISRDWTEAEVKQAIRELANGKSPGGDGIPKELFQYQWELLKKPVMSMVEEFVSSGKLPDVANEAVTILLYKKGEETDVRNYRPITLLTSIYKILAKVVATRMKAVLDQVISKEQFGFLPGRRLADAVSLVADMIETARNEGSDWYLLLIDFEKAYDSVRRGYMLETIGKLGFPPRFVGWIESLHKDVHIKLCINGWVGDQIQMQKGVRQGCPLAPYLFLCAVEPLSRLVEKKELGIGEKGCERLAYVGYADDTTLLLEGEAQLSEAGAVLQEFAVVSGLKVNTGKSAVLPLGKNVGELAPPGLGYNWVEEKTAERLLGVWITPGGDAEVTWEKAFDRVAGELSKWQ